MLSPSKSFRSPGLSAEIWAQFVLKIPEFLPRYPALPLKKKMRAKEMLGPSKCFRNLKLVAKIQAQFVLTMFRDSRNCAALPVPTTKTDLGKGKHLVRGENLGIKNEVRFLGIPEGALLAHCMRNAIIYTIWRGRGTGRS